MPLSHLAHPSIPKAWLAAISACWLGAWPLAAHEAPAEPLEETEAFLFAGASGILVFPAGAPDRRTPAIVILQDGDAPDGRASVYTDQLLGAGIAVLEMSHLSVEALGPILTALAMHPRVAGQPLGLLGLGAGGRLAATLALPVAARVLLYPGCEGIAPASMEAQAVLIMHGAADQANERWHCESLRDAMDQAGAVARLRVFAGAGYAWDRPPYPGGGPAMLPRPDGAGRVRSEAWPELAALSAAEVAGFFATSLLGPRP